ncbi:MAG TPA: ABC transporter permease [Spirochaetia bacterium]|nr:ABC transporter permease [Spirochaetia bacterium]
MRTIAFIIRKEFQQLRRDRRLLPLIFLSPVIQIALLGYAANMDVKDIPLAVCDQDHTVESRQLVSSFLESGSYVANAYVPDAESAERSIEQGRSSLALVIPPGFGRDLAGRRTAPLQLLADGSDSQSAAIGLTYATLIVSRAQTARAAQRLAGLDPRVLRQIKAVQVDPVVRALYNPTLASRNFMVPGVLAMILMIITTILTSLAIVKEKELGTLEQLIVTPITPRQLIIGKLAPFVIISLVIITVVMIASFLLFGIGVRGSLLVLYGLSLLFMLSSLGIGLFVSTVSRTQQQAMMIAMFFFMMPMLILSGFVFPIESMPPVIQAITYIFPLRYYFVIIRGLFLKGVSFAELWRETAALAAIGIVVIAASVLRFRKRLE